MWTVQEAAAKEEQWQKRADQREHERRVRESRKHRQQAQVKSLQTSQSCLPIAVSAPPLLSPPPSPPASPPPPLPRPSPPKSLLMLTALWLEPLSSIEKVLLLCWLMLSC